MIFSELAIGQVFHIIKDNHTLPMRFKKTEVHGEINCVSLWKEGKECKAHCSINQQVILTEELQTA